MDVGHVTTELNWRVIPSIGHDFANFLNDAQPNRARSLKEIGYNQYFEKTIHFLKFQFINWMKMSFQIGDSTSTIYLHQTNTIGIRTCCGARISDSFQEIQMCV